MKRTKLPDQPKKQSKQKMPWKSSVKAPKLTTAAERFARMNKLTGAEDKKAFTNKEIDDLGLHFWKARCTKAKKQHFGRSPIFETPEELLTACCEYFKWVEEHPFYEYKVVGTSYGEPIIENIPKKRPMTQASLCLFLHISQVAWFEYRKKGEGYLKVTQIADDVIREQKFGGAASGFFNTNIIARDLGLVDKKDVTSAGQAIQGSTTIINTLDLSSLTTVELKTLEGLATKLFQTNKVDFEEGDQN